MGAYANVFIYSSAVMDIMGFGLHAYICHHTVVAIVRQLTAGLSLADSSEST